MTKGGHRYFKSKSVPVLAPKSNSVPVLGTSFKMYRLTFAVPVLFEKNVQYQSSTIGGKKK